MNELEELRTFVQLVDSGSATRAAAVRGVAVSAISRRLKELEQRLGVQLLQRTTRRMHLTDEGQLFYRRATRILGELTEAELEVTRYSTQLKGTLKIAAPVGFGVAHLVPAVTAFMHQHPELNLQLDMSDRRIDLLEEGFDLAIRIGSLAASALRARRIADFDHVVCAAPSLLNRVGTPTHPADLEGAPALCYGNLARPEHWRYQHHSRDEEGEFDVSPRLLATNGDAIREAAIAGHGYACEPSFIVHRAVEQGQLVPLFLDYRWYDMGIYAVYPETRHVSQRVRAFIDFLVDRFGTDPYWNRFITRALDDSAIADRAHP